MVWGCMSESGQRRRQQFVVGGGQAEDGLRPSMFIRHMYARALRNFFFFFIENKKKKGQNKNKNNAKKT